MAMGDQQLEGIQHVVSHQCREQAPAPKKNAGQQNAHRPGHKHAQATLGTVHLAKNERCADQKGRNGDKQPHDPQP